ncbi:MAG: hypothetical protein ACRC2T_20465, partial [Thermoguttaceae bacterium]
MKNNIYFYCRVCFVRLWSPKSTGKVTFPEGSPLDVGEVMFQKESFVALGKLKPNVHFLTENKKKDCEATQ